MCEGTRQNSAKTYFKGIEERKERKTVSDSPSRVEWPRRVGLILRLTTAGKRKKPNSITGGKALRVRTMVKEKRVSPCAMSLKRLKSDLIFHLTLEEGSQRRGESFARRPAR